MSEPPYRTLADLTAGQSDEWKGDAWCLPFNYPSPQIRILACSRKLSRLHRLEWEATPSNASWMRWHIRYLQTAVQISTSHESAQSRQARGLSSEG